MTEAISPIKHEAEAKGATTPLTCEPNLRTILDPSGLLRDQSLATTTKTHRQLDVFPNSHTRHSPRNIQHPALPRWRRRSPAHNSLSPRDIAFSEGLNGFPHTDHVDGCSKAPLTHKRAPITSWGVSVPVVLRLPPGHVHNYDFLLAHLERACGL